MFGKKVMKAIEPQEEEMKASIKMKINNNFKIITLSLHALLLFPKTSLRPSLSLKKIYPFVSLIDTWNYDGARTCARKLQLYIKIYT